MLWTSQLK
jgi:hypothetical protein